MGKIKIHEIAKKLGLTSKEVLDVAKGLNIEVKSHLSGVSDEDAQKIEDTCAQHNGKNTEKETKKKEKAEAKKEENSPVIIRREVIIAQEDNEKKKEEKVKREEKKGNVGFVERKQNKDYNIVYRNKPNKPMTVSELFGLNKKEEPKKEEKEKTEVKKSEIVEEKKVSKTVVEETNTQTANKEVTANTVKAEKTVIKVKDEKEQPAEMKNNNTKPMVAVTGQEKNPLVRENTGRDYNREDRSNNYNNYNNRNNQNNNFNRNNNQNNNNFNRNNNVDRNRLIKY